ncbi:MAG TPA: gamma-glutamyltransferase [Candidatus Bathyarchaeia archaeon]|nr:gamma-glutamyltransferase [Candidatus Bathyarchaeia archaeon]
MPFRHGVVSAAHPLAAKAGIEVLKKGGNAVDAAVATALTLGTVTPAFCGIGGGGFALMWMADEKIARFVDYRERAPHAASENMFKLTAEGAVSRNENSMGYKSIAVPGAVAGHSFMVERFGRLKMRRLFEAAIRHARKGFTVSRTMAEAWSTSYHKLEPFKSSRSIYLKKGRPFKRGGRIRLAQLSKNLSSIAARGPSEFYNGPIGRKLVDDIQANNGLVTADDLERFKPIMREPIKGSYHDFEIISAPPPSSGGAIIIEVLNILENFQFEHTDAKSPRTLHLVSEALRRGFINCRANICDPDFAQVPIETLTSKNFARRLTATIDENKASPLVEPENISGAPTSNTSHLCVVDSDRNVVAVTESVECYFGSGVVVPGTGFVLNDTMHDFDPRPGRLNSVGPEKIPMSSMSPTIVLRDGSPFLAAGSAGSTRIVSSVLQTLLGVLEFDLPIEPAVGSPRIHIQNDEIEAESRIPKASIDKLRRMGHRVKSKRPRELYFGGVHAAMISSDNRLEGVADPRRDGLASGY